MPVKIIDGDLFHTEAKFICHQVNCHGKMGSGVALQVREKYPLAYKCYKERCKSVSDSSELLGQVQIVYIDEDKQSPVAICNLFAQDRYGYDGRCYTDTKAFLACLRELKNQIPKGSTIAMPYKIGCGLGGADWRLISWMIVAELGANYSVELWRKEV
jgi:O-acetyl-ADP-ribose deacetylase (regulator of RNase III)